MFFRKTPEQRRQELLLRHWRAARRQVALQSLPLRLLLLLQSLSMEATPAAGRSSNSSTLLGRLKASRNAVTRRLSASAKSALQLALSLNAWLSRRRCLQPLRRLLVHSRRRLLVWLLAKSIRLVRLLCLGRAMR